MSPYRTSPKFTPAALVLPFLFMACSGQPQPVTSDSASRATEPFCDGHHGLDATLWVQTSAEFQATTLQTFLLASLRLDQALEDSQWTAALEQDTSKMTGLPPAIIVDVDETILDNSPFQARLIAECQVYEPSTWDPWVEQSAAAALEGAREFLQYADSLGVTVFYVTNREAGHEPATRRNLEREQMPIDGSQDVVLMKGENGWSSDKTTRREVIAEGHRILLLLGDDLNDFVSGAKQPEPEPRRALADRHQAMWGMKWFLLANPSYGSWEASLYEMDFRLSEAEKQRLKRRHLFLAEP